MSFSALVLGAILPPASAVAAAGSCLGFQSTHSGDNASDGTIQGTDDADVIDGSGGTYTINALGGDDLVCGGAGDDTINGGPGTDAIDGGDGKDTINGDDNDDLIFSGLGDDVIDGGPSDSGGDWIYFYDILGSVTVDLERGSSRQSTGETDDLNNLENVYGSPGHDTIFGDDAANYLVGWEGNDLIGARNGDDVVNGMAGNDAMFGGGGLNDWLVYFDADGPVTADLQTGEATVGFNGSEPGRDGLSGFESLSGSDHDDFLYGDAGKNYLAGADGEDTLDGRDGFDTAMFYRAVVANLRHGKGTSWKTVTPPRGDEPYQVAVIDTLLGLEGLWGSPDWDTLIGDGANNLLRGDAASDDIRGAGGQDYFIHEDDVDQENDAGSTSGGKGSYDLADYSLSPDRLNIDLVSGLNDLGGQLVGVEGLRGSDRRDVFTGNDLANFFFGGGGDDVLRGKHGRDGLAGGEGVDKLAGGRASDRCIEGEQISGCEKLASPKHHPLTSIAGSMSRPAALEAGAVGPEEGRRYK